MCVSVDNDLYSLSIIQEEKKSSKMHGHYPKIKKSKNED